MVDAPKPRGRPPGSSKPDDRKQHITIRLDRDLVDALRAGGSGWQTRLNAILREKLLGETAA